ncbi:MAG TPA: choice-of-anchor tandem repeat GloVer-containing protein, partial [Thermoanaerobaculia bacterium]|nr:choice-of-anchor tandem repeat GloVer-containing protein [Thermoanaerobaculia bacterium]
MAHAAEPSYSILHTFQGAESNPHASLISDGNGNLYGTTAYGGSSDGGTVFTVRIDGTGFERLHAFTGGASDGLHPEASLVLDESGNLYGTTARGGTSDGGIAFALRAHGGGFQVLHSFMGGANDGQLPFASLTLDGTGNLYGTTLNGGPSNAGIVFKQKTDGTSFQILHSFAGGLGDGQGPRASLLLDESGYLYGTTAAGGQEASYGAGTIFRIKTDATGFQVLHAFSLDAKDGAYPSGALITDGSGILYGMTAGGGSSNAGTVFRVAKDSSGFEILHSFKAGANDERNPVGSLVLDRSGNLYGMTQGEVTEQIGFGGGLTTVGPAATIFKIRTDAAGYQLLHS